MRILIVATGVFLKGGIERYTRYQYKAIGEIYGNENVYLASLLGDDKKNSFETEIKTEYVQGGIGFMDKLLFLVKCLLLIRKYGIDIVICNHRQLSIIGYLGKMLFGIKFLTNIYGLEIWSGMNKIETMALLKSDRLIGDCNFIIDYLQKNYNYPSSRMDLLYDPVDTNRFKPAVKKDDFYSKFGIPKGKFIVATIGRLERNKGHETIINTLPLIDENIIYLIVGGGSRADSLKEIVASAGLQNRVIFTGRVTEDELVDAYNVADVIVLLSTFGNNEGEGLPLGLIEASACGKPIICGNQDGSQDAVSSEMPNGVLINPTDEAELKLVICQYFEDERTRTQHGANGRKFVIQNFDYEKFKTVQQNIISSLGN